MLSSTGANALLVMQDQTISLRIKSISEIEDFTEPAKSIAQLIDLLNEKAAGLTGWAVEQTDRLSVYTKAVSDTIKIRLIHPFAATTLRAQVDLINNGSVKSCIFEEGCFVHGDDFIHLLADVGMLEVNPDEPTINLSDEVKRKAVINEFN